MSEISRGMARREALIEEAAKAIYDEGPRIWEPASAARYAQLALAVFEQAHTPTNDEREALHAERCGCQLPQCEFIEGWDACRRPVQGEPGEHGGPIPLYGMLDVWTALYGTSHPEFDELHAEHGYAETWARILAAVRERRPVQGEPTDARFRGIVGEVVAEAQRSIAKHGEQGDLPMGTGPGTYPLATDGPAMFDTLPAEDLAEIATADTKYHSRNEGGNDTCTWWHILREEVFEAAAESDPAALAEELVQVAAVAVKMIDALRAAAAVTEQGGEGQ